MLFRSKVTAQGKMAALTEAGATVVMNPTEIGAAMADVLANL